MNFHYNNDDYDHQALLLERLAVYVSQTTTLKHLDLSGMNIKDHLVKAFITDGIRKACV